jgi:hypothetical protein
LSFEIKYAEQSGQEYAGYQEVIPFMSKEPDLQLRGKESGDVLTIPWEQAIHKHVRTSDNVDVGDVDKVGSELIIVRDRVANIHLYYVPKPYITNYDGSSYGLTYPADLLVLNSNVKKNQRKKKSIC